MMERLDDILVEQRKTREELEKINVTLIKQHFSLEEHIQRTNMLEKRMGMIEEFIIPIKKHILLINAGVKIIAFLAAALVALKQLNIFDISKFF